MKLKGKKIIVTGGARGMGASAVKILKQEGAVVVSIDVTPTPENKKIDGVIYLQGNVADKDNIINNESVSEKEIKIK